jgi:hypothetical protein
MTLARAAALTLAAVLAVSACAPKGEEDAKVKANGAAETPSAAAQPAAAAAMAPAAGLWKTTVSMNGAQTNATRMCYDADLAEKIGVTGRTPAQGAAACTETVNRQPDGSVQFTSTCAGRTASGVMRGDLSKAYTVEMDSSGQKMKLEAVREGDCPADFKPGDMEVQGVRLNILQATRP